MTNAIKEKEEMTVFIEKVLVSVLMLAMGVLFCVNITAAVSITIGVILCVYGVVNIAIIGVSRRPLFSFMGVLSATTIAIGIAFCTHDLATVVVLLIPFILTTAGALMLIDAFLTFFKLKQGGIKRLLLFFICGSAMFSLGLCILCIHEFRIGYAELIFGIMLCVAATLLLTISIIGRIKKKNSKANESPAQPLESAEEKESEETPAE